MIKANDKDVQTNENESIEIQVTATDTDENIVFWIKQGPDHGSLQGINQNQVVTDTDNIVSYIPDEGFTGVDSFLVMPGLCDGCIGTSDTHYETGTISIEVIPPSIIPEEVVTASAGVDQTVRPGDTVTLDGSDSEGSNLNFEWERTNNDPLIID